MRIEPFHSQVLGELVRVWNRNLPADPVSPARLEARVLLDPNFLETSRSRVVPLIKEARLGAEVHLLHLTRGGRGHPQKPPAEYERQKEDEARACAEAMGAAWAQASGPGRSGKRSTRL
jgi:hypothetical protein